MKFTLLRTLSPGLVLIRDGFGEFLWTIGQTKGRPRKCEACSEEIPQKADAWRPVSNANNRMYRLCVRCVLAWQRT